MNKPNLSEATSGGMDEANPSGELYRLLTKQPFFAGLSPHQLQLLADSAILIRFEPDQYIYRQGTPANRFYLILEGKVEVEMESMTGEDAMIPIRTLGAGEDLGWDWLFPPFYFHAGARTVEPTKTISFYGTRLRQQCENDHDLGYEIMKRIAAVAVQSFSVIQEKLAKSDSAKTWI